MNPKILLALLFAAVAAAGPQQPTITPSGIPIDVPACYYTCLDFMQTTSQCPATDVKCSCADLDASRRSYQCLVGACTKTDLDRLLKLTIEICRAYGHEYTDEALAFVTGTSTTSSVQPTGSASAKPTSAGGRGGVSRVVIGVAIGAVVIVFALAIGAFLLLRRRRHPAVVPPNPHNQYPQQPPQMEPNPLYLAGQQDKPPEFNALSMSPPPQPQHMPPPQQAFPAVTVYEMDPTSATTGAHEVAGDTQWKQGKE